ARRNHARLAGSRQAWWGGWETGSPACKSSMRVGSPTIPPCPSRCGVVATGATLSPVLHRCAPPQGGLSGRRSGRFDNTQIASTSLAEAGGADACEASASGEQRDRRVFDTAKVMPNGTTEAQIRVLIIEDH